MKWHPSGAGLRGAAILIMTGGMLAPSASYAEGMGVPPPDAKAAISAPTAPGEEPKIERKLDGTIATLSAGGMLSTGNSRQAASTGNGSLETRFGGNAIGVSLLGNYGESAPPGQGLATTTENAQGRLRYDRFVIDTASLFLINTGRHDRFQGVLARYNLDPGFKYIVWHEGAASLWGEGGYDFQYDVRRNDARIVRDANKNPVVDPVTGQYQVLDKTATDHSARVFVGLRYAFNSHVTLSSGLEYLQSVVDSDRARVNFDAVFAAKITGGLALGLGYSARYDHAPLPGKQDLDTAMTLNVIYSHSTVQEPPKLPLCPCPPPPPVPAQPAEGPAAPRGGGAAESVPPPASR